MHQIRASICLFLLVWAAELILDAEDDPGVSSADLGLGLGFPSSVGGAVSGLVGNTDQTGRKLD